MVKIQSLIFVNSRLLSWMNKTMDRKQKTNYHMRHSEDLAITGVANRAEPRLSVTSLGDKDQWGLSYRLYYRECCAPTCAERNLWAIRHRKIVQGDLPVAYTVVGPLQETNNFFRPNFENNFSFCINSQNIWRVVGWVLISIISWNIFRKMHCSLRYQTGMNGLRFITMSIVSFENY